MSEKAHCRIHDVTIAQHDSGLDVGSVCIRIYYVCSGGMGYLRHVYDANFDVSELDYPGPSSCLFSILHDRSFTLAPAFLIERGFSLTPDALVFTLYSLLYSHRLAYICHE